MENYNTSLWTRMQLEYTFTKVLSAFEILKIGHIIYVLPKEFFIENDKWFI